MLEVFKNYVKVKTQFGERILRMRSRTLPERGWILEFRDSDPSTPFVGSVVLDSMNPLPPLKDVIPIIENTGGVSDSFDVIFLSEVTRAVLNRLGEIPNWYYKRLGKYYREGEKEKEGVFSELVYELIKNSSDVKKVRPDPNDSFGDWLNHLSHPYYFRSYSDVKRPMRLFLKKGKLALFRLDRLTTNHGRVVIEGTLGSEDAKLKVISEKPLRADELEDLRRSLLNVFPEVFVVQGGNFLGYR